MLQASDRTRWLFATERLWGGPGRNRVGDQPASFRQRMCRLPSTSTRSTESIRAKTRNRPRSGKLSRSGHRRSFEFDDAVGIRNVDNPSFGDPVEHDGQPFGIGMLDHVGGEFTGDQFELLDDLDRSTGCPGHRCHERAQRSQLREIGRNCQTVPVHPLVRIVTHDVTSVPRCRGPKTCGWPRGGSA